MATQIMEDGADLLTFLAPVLDKVKNDEHRVQAEKVLSWVHTTYPNLGVRIAWNQPMFTQQGTFILGFSFAQKHFSVAPERAAMEHFEELLDQRNISHGTNLFRLSWGEPVPYDLLAEVIDYNCQDKEGATSFWR